MVKISSVEDLEVFKRSHALTVKLYKMTEDFPKEEKFGLISQIRRASSSIAANLMEGGHRLSRKEFRQYVGISKGSVGELKYHLLLARDLGYLAGEKYVVFKNELEELSKMLGGLVKTLSDTDTNH